MPPHGVAVDAELPHGLTGNRARRVAYPWATDRCRGWGYPLAGHALDERLLFLDDALEAGPCRHTLDVGGQLGPALRIHLAGAVGKVHELGAGGDVSDRKAIPDQPIAVAKLALQVVEVGR